MDNIMNLLSVSDTITCIKLCKIVNVYTFSALYIRQLFGTSISILKQNNIGFVYLTNICGVYVNPHAYMGRSLKISKNYFH